MLNERLSVAPMVEVTDMHFRYFLRGLSKCTVLYTEMIVDDVINHSPNIDFLIGRNIQENPSVIQLGGHNAETLAQATETCSRYGEYSEINLNCGCPSQRVSQRCFGAKLMEEPDYVREIVHQMQRRTDKSVTIKCRIGVDDKDSYEELRNFIHTTHQGGVKKFIIHSRKCFLKGFSTKQNRDIPPLKYDIVHQLAYDFPDLSFILNGGIMNFEQAKSHLVSPWVFDPIKQLTTNENKKINKKLKLNDSDHDVTKHSNSNDYSPSGVSNETAQSLSNILGAPHEAPSPIKIYSTQTFDINANVKYSPVHGIMIGRAFHNTPLMLATADSEFFNTTDHPLTRRDILERYIKYCEFCQSEDGPKNYSTVKNKVSMSSTSILLKPVHSVMNGLYNSPKYKMLLNDLYVVRVKRGVANPSCREVIEGAMDCIADADLDRIINPTSSSSSVR